MDNLDPFAAYTADVAPPPIAPEVPPPKPLMEPRISGSRAPTAPGQAAAVSKFESVPSQRTVTDDPFAAYTAGQIPERPGAFSRGVQAGVYGTAQAGYALKGLAQHVLGDEQGMRDTMAYANLLDNKASALAPRYNTIQDVIANGDVGDVLSYLGFNLGQQMPNIATTIASGGLGGTIAKMAGEAAAKKLITQEAKDLLIRKFIKRGALAGAYVSTAGTETGATAQEGYQATGEMHPLASIGAGLIKGGLELATPAALASRFGLEKGLASGFLDTITGAVEKRFGGGVVGRTVGTALGSTLEEATTEGLQETVDAAARAYVDKNYKFFSQATRDRIINAAATGGLVGAVFGGGAGVLGGGHAAQAGEPPAPPNPTDADIANRTAAAASGATAGAPVGPGSAAVAGVASPVPTAADGSVRNVANGPVPTLGDLPKKIDIASLQATPGLIIPPEAVPHVTQAIMSRNAALRMAQRNVPAAQIAKTQAAAAAALTAAHNAGLRYAGTPTDTTVLAPGATVGGGPAPAPTTAAATNIPPAGPAVAGTAPGVIGPGVTTTAGPPQVPTAAGGARSIPTPVAAAAAASPSIAANTALAIPKHANPHIDAMLQGFRDIINQQGGLARLHPDIQKGFTSEAPQAALLGGVRGYIEHQVRLQAAKSAGVHPNDVQATLNFDTGNVDVSVGRPDGANSQYTVPTAELLQKKTEEYITEKMQAGQPMLDYKLVDKARADAFRVGDRRLQNISLVDEVGTSAVQTVDGKLVHPDNLAPGTVAVAGADPSKTIEMTQIKYIQQLINRFMPGQKLIIKFGDGKAYGGYAGYYMRAQDNNNIIALNYTMAIGPNGGPFRVVSTLFHELGHMLVHHIFKNEPLAVQTALYNAWVTDMNKPGTMYDLALATASINRASGIVYQTSATFDNQNFLDWFNFDEWMSEQISRYHITNEKAVGVVNKYFKNAAQKLKTMWSQLFNLYKGKTGVEFEANAVVAGWLESLYKNRITGQPIAQPTIMEAMKESSMKNLKYSNQQLDPLLNSFEDLMAAAPPEAPESVGVRRALEQRLFAPNTGPMLAAQSDKYSTWIKRTWNLLQIAKQNLHIATLQQYVGYVRQWSIARMQLISRANTTLKLWRQLGKNMGNNLGNFLYDIDSMSYLPPGSRSRWPTPAEEAALVAKHNLDPKAMAVYASVRDQFNEILDRLEKAWINDAMQIRDPMLQAQKLMEINREMQLLKIKPYFPHSRYGDWTMSIRDARGKLINFQQFESKRARDDAIAPARAAYPGHAVTGDKMPEEVRLFSGIPPGVLRALKTKLGLTAVQQNWLDNFIFDMSPANSFAKKFKKRKNIAGFDLNAQRAFANYFMHAAGHIARLEYGEQLQQSVNDTRLSAIGDLTGKRQDIASWMQRHLDYIMHPPNEFRALQSVAFHMYLGFAPDSMLLNLTQVPMVAAPYLSSRFGNLKIIPAFMRAGVDLRKMYDDPANSRLPIDETTALDEGTQQGFLDQSQAAELAAASEATTMMKVLPGTSIQRGIMTLGHISSYLFQAAEKINRKVVFMTAYRLAKQNPTTSYLAQLEGANTSLFQDLLSKGWPPENARAFLAGRDAVDTTQFEYARWTRPEFMRGKKGIFFTFYMYKQNMLHFFRHQPGGYKALALVLAFAGLQGLPWEEEFNELLRYVTGKLSEYGVGGRLDINAEMRKFLAELTDRPDLIMHGLGRETMGLALIGDALGVPIPSVDVSSRMGFGQVDPIVHPLVRGLETGQTFPELAGNVAVSAAGATFGVGLALAKALSSGDLTSVRTWMPLMPHAIANVVKAYDLLEQGGYVNNPGAKMVPFDITDTKTMAEIIAQGMGFTPTPIAQQRELSTAQTDAYKYWTMRRNILLDNLWKAFQAHDADGMNSARARIQYFNQTAPDPRLRLKSASLLASMKARQKSIRRMEQDQAPNTTLRGIGAQVKSLYPEVQQ